MLSRLRSSVRARLVQRAARPLGEPFTDNRQVTVSQRNIQTGADEHRSSNGGVDPAHQYWIDRGQGDWNMRRFARESFWGLRGYAASHFRAPSLVPAPEVANDPARLNWHNQLVGLLTNREAPPYLIEQWLWQNESQARGGNPLPIHAGEEMIRGARQMGRAGTLPELVTGYMHAQMNSLGGQGFTGLASRALHHMAPLVQVPGMVIRGTLTGVQSVTQGDSHPVRDITRGIGSAYVSIRDSVRE